MRQDEAAARIEARIESLYGAGTDLAAPAGVLHVVAIARDPQAGSGLSVLRIGPDAPRSATDAFVLALSRARADAIVTTGAVLRSEPDLCTEIFGPDADDLRAWRNRRRGVASCPVLVLTRGNIDLDHPTLQQMQDGAGAVVVTGREGAQRLGAVARRTSLQVVGLPDPSLAAAIAWAQTELGARTVSVEAGWSAARSLYPGVDDEGGPAHPRREVDELMLSVYAGELRDEARGRPFASVAQLRGALSQISSHEVREASGPWSFSRWIRDASPGTNRNLQSSR